MLWNENKFNYAQFMGIVLHEVAPQSGFYGHHFNEIPTRTVYGVVPAAGCTSCWIVSEDVSNCSYQLSVIPLTSAHLSLA